MVEGPVGPAALLCVGGRYRGCIVHHGCPDFDGGTHKKIYGLELKPVIKLQKFTSTLQIFDY